MGFQLHAITVVTLIVMSTLLAYMSYRFIESIKFKTTFSLILILSVFAFGANLLGKHTTNARFFKKQTLATANYFNDKSAEIDKQFSRKCCFIATTNYTLDQFKQHGCLKIDSAKKNVLLLGDSHAACLSESFREQLRSKNINLLQATSSYPAYPFLWENGSLESSHQLFHYIFYDFLIKNKMHIDGVILGGAWYSNGNEILGPLLKVCAYLKQLGIPVVIIGQANVYTIPLPSVMAKGLENNTDVTSFFSDKKAATLDAFLKEKFSPYYVDIYYSNQIPPISSGSEPYMFDSNHFSKHGADLVVKKIISDNLFQAVLAK
jgi:hypothetical protein